MPWLWLCPGFGSALALALPWLWLCSALALPGWLRLRHAYTCRLVENQGAALTVGAFSAASNVTGILADVDGVSALLHMHNALAIWDYATAGYARIRLDSNTPSHTHTHTLSSLPLGGGVIGSPLGL